MPGKKRGGKDVEIINRDELLYYINGMTNARNRALAAFIYLTGARISEIVGGHKWDKENFKWIPFDPIKKEQVEWRWKDDLIIVWNVPCLKRRELVPTKRNIPIIYSQEEDFVKIFYEYYRRLQPGDFIFDITRQYAWKIINKEMGVFAHFLIHERCTHLVVNKNFNEIDLMHFRGWKDTKPAAVYSRLNYRDIAEKMRKA